MGNQDFNNVVEAAREIEKKLPEDLGASISLTDLVEKLNLKAKASYTPEEVKKLLLGATALVRQWSLDEAAAIIEDETGDDGAAALIDDLPVDEIELISFEEEEE